MYDVLFYVAYPYYFPHFTPIADVLHRRGYRTHFVLSEKQNTPLMERIAREHQLDYSVGEAHLFSLSYDYIFFANPYERLHEIKAKKLFLEHGIGTKSTSFYEMVKSVDYYLTEGSYKYNRIKSLYPAYADRLRMVGFSKFDTIVNMHAEEKSALYREYRIDPEKKTILYAPTFFPSSIEKMSDNFPHHFKEYNIVIKAHYFTYERRQYRQQREKLKKWRRFPNCTVLGVEHYSLLPLFAVSDVMISDESSAMFEFAALDKPVISNRYFKLRLSYYLMPWKLHRRIDQQKEQYRRIFSNAHSYRQTLEMTKEALHNPGKRSPQRRQLSHEICGTIDGKVSERIADIIGEDRG